VAGETACPTKPSPAQAKSLPQVARYLWCAATL